MATETFPSQFLRGPLLANLTRQKQEGFNQSDVASGKPFNVRTSFDNPVVYNLQFAFEGNFKKLFESWVREKLDDGIKPFNIDLPTEYGKLTQEAWFLSGGAPQVTSIQGNVYQYSAQIILRKLDLTGQPTYDELEFLMENGEGCGEISSAANLLDIIVNQEWPE